MSIKFLSLIAATCLVATAPHSEELIAPRLGQPVPEIEKSVEWNIDFSYPSGVNLPEGQGTAFKGKSLYNEFCIQCHGPHGRGATSPALTGDVGSLRGQYPWKTVNSYWPYGTTVFNYIYRAMPPSAPYSLEPDEVYSLIAYLLSVDDLYDEKDVLDKNQLIELKMPNRKGFQSQWHQVAKQ